MIFSFLYPSDFSLLFLSLLIKDFEIMLIPFYTFYTFLDLYDHCFSLFYFTHHVLNWIPFHLSIDSYVFAHDIFLHINDPPSSILQSYLSRTIPVSLSLITFFYKIFFLDHLYSVWISYYMTYLVLFTLIFLLINVPPPPRIF